MCAVVDVMGILHGVSGEMRLEEEECFGVWFVEFDDVGLVGEFLAKLLEEDFLAVPDLDVLEL